jgi:hypothetical protein
VARPVVTLLITAFWMLLPVAYPPATTQNELFVIIIGSSTSGAADGTARVMFVPLRNSFGRSLSLR